MNAGDGQLDTQVDRPPRVKLEDGARTAVRRYVWVGVKMVLVHREAGLLDDPDHVRVATALIGG